ncbi:tRNA-specific adenosine deaminase 1 [Dissophora globulifera]|nr:tRNA-specific adenosine deaminase 1 [Dissophora globulifera]
MATTAATNDDADPSECHHTLGFRRGRVDYDSVGVLRTKPGRVDSEPTLSMSCSDKIARWGVQGLTSALVAAFLETPIYLSSVITRELFDAAALKRALLERIVVANCACLDKTQLSDGSGRLWRPHPVQIHASSIVFEFSKEAVTSSIEQKGGSHQPVASSSSISWIASEPSITEVLVNGCKAGASSKQPLPPKSRSRLCKVNMFQSSVALWKSICAASAATTLKLQVPDLIQCMVGTLAVGQQWPTSKEEITYREWKQLAKDYTAVKEDLFRSVFQNWVRGDEAFEQFNVEGTSLIITRP